jgi:hypothetical protein
MSESLLLSRKRLPCWTDDKDETFICLDLGAKRLFAPTHYTLCNGSPEPGERHIIIIIIIIITTIIIIITDGR